MSETVKLEDVPTIVLVTDGLENTLCPAFQRVANVIHVYLDVFKDIVPYLKRFVARGVARLNLPRAFEHAILRLAQVNIERMTKFIYKKIVKRGGVDAVISVDPAILPVKRTPGLRGAELILWSIDSHIPGVLNVHAALAANGFFDKVYAAHSSAVKAFKEKGVRAEHLPLGVIGDIFYPRLVANREYKPVFIGSLTRARRELLERLEKLIKAPIEVHSAIQHSYAELMARKFIVLNISRRREVNWRDFEALGTGVLLLRDETREIEEFFRPDVHLVTYNSVEELAEHIQLYTSNREEACRIASRGCEEAWRRHLLDDRVCRIIRDLGFKCSYPVNALREHMITRCRSLCSGGAP